MGKNSRARRAAKVRKRASERGASGPTSDPGPFGRPAGSDGAGRAAPPPESAAVRALRAWEELLFGPGASRGLHLRALGTLEALPAEVVDVTMERQLISLLDHVWSGGWQPTEAVRQVRRRCNAAGVRLVSIAVHADHARRTGQRIDPRWSSQVRELPQQDASTSRGWIGRWRRAEGLETRELATLIARIYSLLDGLPPVDVLVPPPGAPESSATHGPAVRSSAGDPVLERVRKLLAKAEASDFEAEAAAFTAKAQELMTRHAIDEALVTTDPTEGGVRITRLPIDPPYADAKSVLLSVVARASRCRSIGLRTLDVFSVFGHSDDLAAVELLFTSLLVQAQRSLSQAQRGPAGSRTRSQAFRSSFFLSYAERIGQRLDRANDDAVTEAGPGALPVLRRRDEAAAELLDELYGDTLIAGSVRGGYDPLGHAQGRAAADRATLATGELR